MVRKNSVRAIPEPAPSWLVTDEQLAAARVAADEAAAKLAEAGRVDVGESQWAERYETALATARIAAGRLESLEHMRTAQLEQARQRAAAVQAATPQLKIMESELTASRDRVSSAAVGHLAALAALDAEVARHNELVQLHRGRLAEFGLAADIDASEGVTGRGLRLGGTEYTPVPADGVAANAVRQVFEYTGSRGLLSQLGRYRWRPGDVEQRPDGLVMPTLPSTAGAPLRKVS
jgi:hypothetical protein